jgi:hypothetical protein
VYVPAAKLRVLQLLDLPPHLMGVVCSDPRAQIHVGCTSLAPDELQAYLAQQQQQRDRQWARIMGFRATGEALLAGAAHVGARVDPVCQRVHSDIVPFVSNGGQGAPSSGQQMATGRAPAHSGGAAVHKWGIHTKHGGAGGRGGLMCWRAQSQDSRCALSSCSRQLLPTGAPMSPQLAVRPLCWS